MRELGMSRSTAYQRLNSLTRDGLLEHHAVLYGRPGMYTATLAGLRWQGISHLGVFNVSPGGFEHAWQVAQSTIELGMAMLDWDLMSERELRSMEKEHGKLIASAQVGQPRFSREVAPSRHRLDMHSGILSYQSRSSCRPSQRPRLDEICRGWARARHVDTVYYLAAPGPRRAVERAVAATKASDRIRVLGLEDIPQLAEEQYAAEEQLMGARPNRARRRHRRVPGRTRL